MPTLRAGDLVYLPAHFILTKRNEDGTTSAYLETKIPYTAILLGVTNDYCRIFYRGGFWEAPLDMVETFNRGERNVSHVDRSSC